MRHCPHSCIIPVHTRRPKWRVIIRRYGVTVFFKFYFLSLYLFCLKIGTFHLKLTWYVSSRTHGMNTYGKSELYDCFYFEPLRPLSFMRHNILTYFYFVFPRTETSIDYKQLTSSRPISDRAMSVHLKNNRTYTLRDSKIVCIGPTNQYGNSLFSS